MEAIDELISAAQTFYDDARANENGRSRSWEHCYRVFRDARTDPSGQVLWSGVIVLCPSEWVMR